MLCVLRLTSLCIVNTDECRSLGSYAKENEAGPRFSLLCELWVSPWPSACQQEYTSIHTPTNTHEEILIKTYSACTEIYTHIFLSHWMIKVHEARMQSFKCYLRTHSGSGGVSGVEIQGDYFSRWWLICQIWNPHIVHCSTNSGLGLSRGLPQTAFSCHSCRISAHCHTCVCHHTPVHSCPQSTLEMHITPTFNNVLYWKSSSIPHRKKIYGYSTF